MKRFNFFQAYLDTILSIIEDKPRFEIPIAVYKFTLLVSFIQIGMYLFSDYSPKTSDDLKLSSAFSISEMVSLVNILNQKQSDNLSLLVYFLTWGFMALYFMYVALVTLVKQYLQETYRQFENRFVSINTLLNLYFTFYLNLFFSQYIELNLSLLFCSSKSLISNQRHSASAETSCSIPSWQIIVGIIGVLLAILTACIIGYFFRNYEFLEKNVLKRKFTFLYLILMSLRVIITFLEFNRNLSSGKVLKHLICQLYGIVSLIDYFHSIPFTDQDISKYYLMIVAYFECIVTCSNFLFLTNYINGSDMFYLSIVSGLIVSAGLKQALNYQYERILQGDWKYEKLYSQLDYYLELICILSEKGIVDEQSRLLLQKSYRLHQSGCQMQYCMCHKYPVVNMKMISDQSYDLIQDRRQEVLDREFSHLLEQNINQKLVLRFIDDIFQQRIQQKCTNQNIQEFEKLSLKYITFLMKFQNNPVRAYYELKLMQKKKFGFSTFFKTISKTLDSNLRHTIQLQHDSSIGNAYVRSGSAQGNNKSIKNQKEYQNIKNIKSDLNVDSLVEVEIICYEFLPAILQIIDSKHDLWVKLQNGYKTMNEFQVDAINLMKKVQSFSINFNKKVSKKATINPDIQNSIQLKKLKLIYFLFVLNDITKAVQEEISVNELKRRDDSAENNQGLSTSIMKGDVCILEVSLSQNYGKIVSKKNEKGAQFFGFSSQEEFQKQTYISDLMPSYIGKVHNQLMKNYIMGTSQRAKTSSSPLSTFIKQNDGYIFPVKIQFDNAFLSSEADFRLNGILVKKREESEYLVFHRSGRVVGMTRQLAKIILSNPNKIPDGETLNKRLNALLMFPQIIKKIASYKNQILEDLSNRVEQDSKIVQESKGAPKLYQANPSTMTNLIEESRGTMILNPKILSAQAKFFSFLKKKTSMDLSQSRKLLNYEDIDILDSESFQLFKLFQNQEFDECTNTTNKSCNKEYADNLMISNWNIQQYKGQQDYHNLYSNNMRQVSQMNAEVSSEFKLYFQYQVQYCYLDQDTEKQASKSTTQKLSNHSYQKSKEIKSLNQNDEFRDIYFLIKMENVVTKQKLKKVKHSAIQIFIRNLAKYLKSTTSIISMCQTFEKVNKNASLSNSETEMLDNTQDRNQFNNSKHIQIFEFQKPSVREEFISIPHKMLKQLEIQTFSTTLNSGSEDGSNCQQSKKDNSSRKSSSYITEYSMQDEQGKFENNINYQKLYTQAMRQLNLNLKVNEQLEEFSNKILHLINTNSITKNQLFLIDPNFLIKKLLQKRSVTFELSKALEYSCIQSLFEFQKENMLFLKNTLDSSPSNIYQHNEQKEAPMTFRQINDEQSHLSLSLERIPSNNLAILESHTNRISFHKHSNSQISVNNQTQLEPDYFVDIDQTQRNNVFSKNQLIIDAQYDFDLEKSKSLIQTTNLDISARPILDSSGQIVKNSVTQLLPFDIPEPSSKYNLSSQNTDLIKQQFKSDKIEQQTLEEHYQQINSIINNERINISSNSSTRSKNDNVDSNSQTQDQVVAQILNQKGMVTVKNSLQRASITSSSLTSSSFAGIFVKEIIMKSKIPLSANQYKLLLIIFLFSFIGLNVTNLMIIQSDMTVIFASFHFLIFLFRTNLQQIIKLLYFNSDLIEVHTLNYKNESLERIFLIFQFRDISNVQKNNLILLLFLKQQTNKVFSNNVTILKQPHSFLRDFGKACFGFYLSLEYQLGFLHETNGSIASAFNEYMVTSVTEYNKLIELYSTQLTQLKQAQSTVNSKQSLVFQVYTDRQQSEVEVDYSLLFDQQQYYVMSISQSFTRKVRDDAFLYLRQNYFNFSSLVQDTVNYLVDDTINAVNNLINKFTIVIICAIIGIIFVGIISLPIIKAINAYEEKIMMIVSRINFDTSEIEKCKLLICKKLINVDMIDWLNYNYFDIFSLQTHKNDILFSQSSKHNLNDNLLQTFSNRRNKKRTEDIKKINKGSGVDIIDSSTIQFKNNNDQKETQDPLTQQSQKQGNQQLFNLAKNNQQSTKTVKTTRPRRNQVTDYQQKMKQQANNNYLLQSKIVKQSLTWFNRFSTLLVLTSLNCVYFLIIIIYLTQSNDQLKVPVQMNQRSINMHIILTNLKISTELLAFDFYIQNQLWSNYKITNLQQYYDQMNQSITQLIDIQKQNTAIIYGSNPFPSSIINQLKNMQQGEGCQYLVTYPCQDYNVGLGIQQTITEKIKFIEGYPDVLNPQITLQSSLISYLNDNQHLADFVFSFLSEDELFDVYSNVLNQSISTVSLVIQDFLQNYLIIAGTIMTVFILITILIHWNSLFQRIQLMNLLLTFVPQDKLEEEVTLHMVRQLHRM